MIAERTVRVVVRADASRRIGHGHVMRCLTLADALRARGASVTFVCRAHEGHLGAEIARRGMTVAMLPLDPTAPSGDDGPGSAASIGAAWEADAAETRAVMSGDGGPADWLVVDHYALDARWERAMLGSAVRLLAIDDMADRPHACDLLLDQNLVAGMETRYAGLVPPGCEMLLGPGFALLQPSYGALRPEVQVRSGPVRRVLIFFGGADQDDLAGRALAAMLSLGRADVQVDVVLARGDQRLPAMRAAAAAAPNIRVHDGVPSLAPLIAAADLGVGAGGAASWERLCLGLPTLVVTLAENQEPIARELHERGLVRLLGDHRTLQVRDLALALGEVLETGIDPAWSSACLAMLDGAGAERVAGRMTGGEAPVLCVRSAGPADEALLLEWANDPATRRNSFSPGVIALADHRAWFRDRLARPSECALFIVETPAGLPVGQVRFDREGDAWVVDYSVAPALRGRRLAVPLMRAALGALEGEHPGVPVAARVQVTNAASCRVFEALGFTRHPWKPGVVEYRFPR